MFSDRDLTIERANRFILAELERQGIRDISPSHGAEDGLYLAFVLQCDCRYLTE
ncbi:hypothetical protein Desor_4953 [Desulfosporosinus orientis DSM 765]|uniref:Uncharacterized protein n=1 Tax=Desulfosporosinus orientis (strain ATCC 19365 / DSM 765 / NCIMB 8382 / VKM B-1628 / Singapore I) TaxID=768706 RepID=G7WJ38_DESOD|nr:hypothetical protein [Desulfosporosinus orientis]AET70350.1 hypothetical protein Desor_4953 [Desulfosporosinus orientis DSM 765]